MDFTLLVEDDQATDQFRSFVEGQPATRVWESESDRVATHQYSSGSTGRAKRIGRTHAQWGFEAEAFASAAGIGADDVFLGVAPLFHAYGLGGLITATEVGATTVLQKHVQPFALNRLETLALVRRWNATVLQGVPYMFDLLGQSPHQEPLPSIRHCGCSGAPLPGEIFRAFDDRFGIPVRQEYGSTEAGKIAVNVDSGHARPGRRSGTRCRGSSSSSSARTTSRSRPERQGVWRSGALD